MCSDPEKNMSAYAVRFIHQIYMCSTEIRDQKQQEGYGE